MTTSTPAPDNPAPSSAISEQASATAPGTPPGTAPAQKSPEKSPEERWTQFAARAEAPPGRVRRTLRALGRASIHEWTLAVLGGLALAVVMTWPALRYPAYTVPQDLGDPTVSAWVLAWGGHALLTDPASLWHTNAFFPERYSYVFTDTLLGYAPAGMIGTGPTAALVRYNIIYVLAHALLFIGGYALVRQLGSGRVGAAVAGVAVTYAPWRLAHEGHLNVNSTGGMLLALAMLARGHGWSLRYGYRPARRRPGWVLAGWLVAAWQISLGFAVGLPFVYVLAGIGVVAAVAYGVHRLRARTAAKPFGWRLLAADVAGGLIFAGVGAFMAVPYFKVVAQYPQAPRTIADVSLFSPPLTGFLTAPEQSLIWGDLHEQARANLGWAPEMTLLPGFALLALALMGLFVSVWRPLHRVLLGVAVLVVGILALGTSFLGGRFTYMLLFDNLPGWNALRTSGRLVLWAMVPLALLAAGAVSEFVRRSHALARTRVPTWPGPWLRFASLVPLLLVTVEGLQQQDFPVAPPQPAAMRTVDGPMLVLPTDDIADMHAVLWTTTKFQQVTNGSSSFTPPGLRELREVSKSFPDPASVAALRERGVTTVVLLRDKVGGTPWERAADVAVDDLGIQREDLPDAVVFRL